MGELVSSKGSGGAPFPILPNGINHLLRLSRSLGRPADLHPRGRRRRRRRGRRRREASEWGLRMTPKTIAMVLLTRTQVLELGP